MGKDNTLKAKSSLVSTSTFSTSPSPSSAMSPPPNPSSSVQHHRKKILDSLSGSPSTIWRVRLLFLAGLGGVAAVLGFLSFTILQEAEVDLATSMFASIANRALSEAVAVSREKRWAAITMASLISEMYPHAEEYPFVVVKGFERIANNLLNTSYNLNLGFAPVVESSQQEEWEEFIYSFYEEQQRPLPENLFGKGIWNYNPFPSSPLDLKYRDVGNFSSSMFGSPHNILTPLAQTNTDGDMQPEDVFLFNLHADATTGTNIDNMIECSRQRLDNATRSDRDCGTISSMVKLVGYLDAGTAAITLTPVYPANNDTVMAALVVTPVMWWQLLSNGFGDEVSGVFAVVRQGNESFTYTIQNGIPVAVGPGDLHETRYDAHAKTKCVTQGAYYTNDSPAYFLTLYPSQAFFDVYSTTNPMTATIGAVGIIVLISLLFVFYDFVVRREFLAKKELLHAKRAFVRFVSHEVRTPLNACCMGLTLLQTEIAKSMGYSTINDMVQATQEKESMLSVRNLHSSPIGAELDKSGTCDTATGSSATRSGSQDLIQNRDPKHSPRQIHSEFQKDTAGEQRADAIRKSTEQTNDDVIDWFRLSQEILRNTHSAVDVLSDVLNYDKIESGTLTLELGEISIWKLVENCVQEFRLSARRKKISLNLQFGSVGGLVDGTGCDDEESGTGRFSSYVTCAQDVPSEALDGLVIGDAVRLTQVLRNLISNAIKFAPSEEGLIQITAIWNKPILLDKGQKPNPRKVRLAIQGEELSYSSNGHVTIHVRDNGVGLTQTQLQHLFREGMQFNAAELQHGKGSGFGLFIAKGIVEMHEGSLVADSEGLDQGTTFSLTIPFYTCISEDSSRVEKPVETVQGLPVGSEHSSRLDILVVDDVVSNRKLLARLLMNANHSVDIADDGDTAVRMVLEKMANGGRYDSILLDYEMPRMNGPSAVTAIRQHGSDSFVVGVTGNVLPEDVSHFLSSGANAVLAKPLKISDLDDLWMGHHIVSRRDPSESTQR